VTTAGHGARATVALETKAGEGKLVTEEVMPWDSQDCLTAVSEGAQQVVKYT